MSATKAAPGKTDQGVLQRRIRERLMALRRTPRSVSIDAGLSPDALRMILSGRSQNPRSDTLAALATVLECDVDYLLGTTTESPVRRAVDAVTATSVEEDAAFLLDLRAQISNGLRIAIDRRLANMGDIPDHVSEELAKTPLNSLQILLLSAHIFECISSIEQIQLKLFERITDSSDSSNIPVDYTRLKFELQMVIQDLRSFTAPEDIRGAVRLWAIAFSSLLRSPTRAIGSRTITRQLSETLRNIDTDEMLAFDRKIAAKREAERAAQHEETDE